MTTQSDAQLAILADALTEIVDLATVQPNSFADPADLLARAADIAAGALTAAATYGQLPPFQIDLEMRNDAKKY